MIKPMRTDACPVTAIPIVTALAVLLSLFGFPSAGPNQVGAQEYGGAFAEAVAKAQARTVKVYGAGVGRRIVGYATGILVSKDGVILTALGVHLNQEPIRIVFSDGSVHQAKVIRRSQPLQLAMLKVDAPTPEHFEVSPAPAGEKGDWVLAVTNAFKVADGPEPLSVTLGVVSLRTQMEAKYGVQDIEYAGDVLLLDCITSNPGAPGGAVIDAGGNLVGMVGRMIESKSTNTRINYAVPRDILYKFMTEKPSEQENGAASPRVVVRRPITAGKASLGIRLFKLGGRRGPAYVDRVARGGPASNAGIKTDDLIVALDGESVRNIREYEEVLRKLTPGEAVDMVVKRGNKLLQITITPK